MANTRKRDSIKKEIYKKFLSMILTAALGLVSLTGCVGGENTGTESLIQTGTVIQEEAADTEAVQIESKIFIKDAAGREIELAAPAERIVSGYYITTSMLIALKLEDRVVGIESKAQKRPIYKLSAPEFLELPGVGTAKDFDIEACVSLDPDLVILPKKLTEQAEILEGLGVNAMVVNPESSKELKETILNIGEATGSRKQAEQLISYYDEKRAMLETIKKEAKSSEKEPPAVYISGVAGILRTAGRDMYQNELIEMAGGINAAADLQGKGWSDISYEALLTYNPDMIVIIPEAEYSKEDVLSDAQLQKLTAVKEGKVYQMPEDFEAWDSPVTSGILGCMWLSSIINEEQYPIDTFKKDVADFYRSFYDIEINKDLINMGTESK